MHHIYHTEAIVLGSKNFAEDSKYYILFTKDLGLIFASARGVRKLSSRLRFVLQDFSYIKVDLIQSKDFWKITTATKTPFLVSLVRDVDVYKSVSNISNLLKKLLVGDEKNERLFTEVFEGFSFLDTLKDKKFLPDIEIAIVLRILNNLGYLGQNKNVDNLINSPFQFEMLERISQKKTKILPLINKAIKESHL